MSNKWIGVSVGALALTWMLSSTSGAAEVKTIAILTPEQGTDFGWNQQGIDAAKAAGAKEGVKVLVAQNLGYGDVRPTLRELAENGANLLIAHASGYNTAAPEIGAETHVPVAVVDRPGAGKLGVLADYTLSGHEGAYLAGRLAAKMTRTGTVGIVVSGEPPSWNSQSAAFAQGAKAENPKVNVRYAVIGPAAYSDAAGGKRVTDAVIAAGADVIFGQGNGSSFGMIEAVETSKATDGGKVYFIDVIGDKTQPRQGQPPQLRRLGHDARLHRHDRGLEERQVRRLRIQDQPRRQFGPSPQDKPHSGQGVDRVAGDPRGHHQRQDQG